MNQLLRIILKGERVLINNGKSNLCNHPKALSFRSCNYAGITFSSRIAFPEVGTDNHHVRKKHSGSGTRFYTKNGTHKGSQVQMLISKSLNQRKNGKKKLREALEDRQRKFQQGVENALEERKMALTITRRKIQERGKLIMQDIKETKEKMKERIEEVIEKENVYTIPNLLCVTRIGLSPFLGYLIISQQFGYALVFMSVAGISDWIDGWIARNYKSQSSKIGSFLDPMADKVLIGTLFLSLTYIDHIPLALTALIIGRDVILIISGFVIRYRSLPPPRTLSRYFDVTHATAQLAPTFISKINTGIQLVLVAATLAAPTFGYVNHSFLEVLWYVTASSTVAAACSYIFSKETYKYLKTKGKTRIKMKEK